MKDNLLLTEENLLNEPIEEGEELMDDHTESRYTGEHRSSSFLKTFLNLFKTYYGLGILNYPQALSRAGSVFGPVSSLALFLIIAYCLFILLKCAREVRKRYNKEVIGFAGTSKYSLLPYLGSKSRFFVYLINFFIIGSQLGGCIAYIDFTAHTLFSIISNDEGDVRIWIGVTLLVVLVPSMISNFEMVAIFSGGANIFAMFGLSATLYYAITNIKSPKDYPTIGPFKGIPIYFSTIFFFLKNTPSILPIENEAKDPKAFNLALYLSMSISYVFILIFGYVCYCTFNEKALDTVTLNLPHTAFYNTVKVLYALSILLSYFISFHIAMTVMIPSLESRTENPRKKILIKLGFKFFVVIFLGICAIGIPRIQNIISLLGSFSGTPLAIIFPCIIHIATYWRPFNNSPANPWYRVMIDIIIIIIGCFLFATGVYTSISSIIHRS